MKTKYTPTLLVLALAATGTYGHAQTPAPVSIAAGITFAQYKNDVKTMEANADYARTESDFNDAKAKYNALMADAKLKIQEANAEINVRIDAYSLGTTLTKLQAHRQAEQALASTLKPFNDTIAQVRATLDEARKDAMAKGVMLNNIEFQLLPTVDPAMADVVAKGKDFLAHLAADYQPTTKSFPNFKAN